MQYKGYEFEEVDVSEWMQYDADKQAAYHEWLQSITFGDATEAEPHQVAAKPEGTFKGNRSKEIRRMFLDGGRRIQMTADQFTEKFGVHPVDNHFRRPLLKLLEPGEVLRVSLGAGLIIVSTEFDDSAGRDLEADAYRQQGVHSERERVLSIVDEVMPKGLLYNGYTMALKAKIKGE
ncbi:hypothetical protein UGKSKPNP2_00043 [Klebsiella phage UGKSKpnP2]|nr:hypothetical protein UGKSKPNP2_00043 [Klebsiella phage UGKSKpnP2]CAH1616226.1 hypothetical protein UGKSKPNP1_00055 [Klebsiella phage UGKSKpnP1]CAH1616600.1 hypothetical protein UGKSKPNP3_00056 [Klebsiella phage UGKSKpnP3]